MANTFNAITSGAGGIATTGDSSGAFSFTKDGGASEVYIDASGNVGIGTSSPSVKFQVNGEIRSTNGTEEVIVSGTNGSIEIVRTAGNPFIDFKSAIAEDFDCRIQQDNNGLAFSTGGNGAASERMRIASNGQVLMGTSSSLGAAVLGIYSTDLSNVNTGIYIKNGTNNTTGWFIGFQNYLGNTIGSVNQNATTTVQYSTSSDYRLKENVQPIKNALDKVYQLKPVTYTWKDTNGEIGEGFIAHELAEVCPQAVCGEKDAIDADGNPIYQGIDTSFLVATLTAAIQEQQELIKQLQADVAALKAK